MCPANAITHRTRTYIYYLLSIAPLHARAAVALLAFETVTCSETFNRLIYSLVTLNFSQAREISIQIDEEIFVVKKITSLM